jgi:hypothetical protein
MAQVYHKVELLSPDTAFYIEFYGKEEGMVQPPSAVPTIPIGVVSANPSLSAEPGPRAIPTGVGIDINVPIDAACATRSHGHDISADINGAVNGADQVMSSFWVFQIVAMPIALVALLYVVASAVRRRH